MTKLTFNDLGLKEGLLKAVTDLGFTTPSDIQAEAIPVALKGQDIIGQAQTGTGKTAAFGLPMLNNITNRKAIRDSNKEYIRNYITYEFTGAKAGRCEEIMITNTNNKEVEPKEDRRKYNGHNSNGISNNKGQRKTYSCAAISNEEMENNKGIYIIYNDDEVYIGSTAINFRRRLQQHYTSVKSPAYDLLHNKGGKFDILWKAPSGTDELTIRNKEEEYINVYVATDDRIILNTAMSTFLYKDKGKTNSNGGNKSMSKEEIRAIAKRINGLKNRKNKKFVYDYQLANVAIQMGIKCLETGKSPQGNIFWVFDYYEIQPAYEVLKECNRIRREEK